MDDKLRELCHYLAVLHNSVFQPVHFIPSTPSNQEATDFITKIFSKLPLDLQEKYRAYEVAYNVI